MASFYSVSIMKKTFDGNDVVLRVTGKDVDKKEYSLSRLKVSWKKKVLESMASLVISQAKIHAYVKTSLNSSWSNIKLTWVWMERKFVEC